MLLGTLVYKFLSGHTCSLLFRIYLGVELLGHTVTSFNCLRNCQIVFKSSCTILHSHQQCMGILIFPYPHQHLLLFVFFIIVTLAGVKWYLIVALICISLIANGGEHLFMCSLDICISSLENC